MILSVMTTGEFLKNWEKVRDGKKDLGNYRLVRLILVSGKVIEQVTLEIIFKHGRDKKVIESSQHRFMKGGKKKNHISLTW